MIGEKKLSEYEKKTFFRFLNIFFVPFAIGKTHLKGLKFNEIFLERDEKRRK